VFTLSEYPGRGWFPRSFLVSASRATRSSSSHHVGSPDRVVFGESR